MNLDIYNQPAKSVTVLCHTSLGDINDPQGRFYLKGNEYRLGRLGTEITRVSEDTKWEECILCWINQTKGFGSRFAVKGNIYNKGEPYWPNFTDYFFCPIQRERDNKLNQIGI